MRMAHLVALEKKLTSICSRNKSMGVESPQTLSADLHNRPFSSISIELSNVKMMELHKPDTFSS